MINDLFVKMKEKSTIFSTFTFHFSSSLGIPEHLDLTFSNPNSLQTFISLPASGKVSRLVSTKICLLILNFTILWKTSALSCQF
jgi:hypothetical protein